MSKSKIDKRLLSAKKMPSLRRTKNGKYDFTSDEVLIWLSSNEKLMMYLFDKLRTLGYIVYNNRTNEWKGCDYHDA